MGGDVVPIPIGQIGEAQPAIVVATGVVARRVGRPQAKDQNRPEAGLSIDWAAPIAKEACGFSTPGHGALNTDRRS